VKVNSVAGADDDNNVGRFGFVRRSSWRDLSPWQEEGVLSEQAVQLWKHRVVVRNDLAFELGQSSFDLCGR